MSVVCTVVLEQRSKTNGRLGRSLTAEDQDCDNDTNHHAGDHDPASDHKLSRGFVQPFLERLFIGAVNRNPQVSYSSKEVLRLIAFIPPRYQFIDNLYGGTWSSSLSTTQRSDPASTIKRTAARA